MDLPQAVDPHRPARHSAACARPDGGENGLAADGGELQGFGLYSWVAAAYLLTNAILIPVTGRLGDLHGRKPYLLAAIALFTLTSALCGLAGSMLQLVLARGLQGIEGGMLIGSAFASVSDLFPQTLERVRWQVMLSAAFGIASALGPALGGWMTEHLGWRSVFYVNLPVGLLFATVCPAALAKNQAGSRQVLSSFSRESRPMGLAIKTSAVPALTRWWSSGLNTHLPCSCVAIKM